MADETLSDYLPVYQATLREAQANRAVADQLFALTADLKRIFAFRAAWNDIPPGLRQRAFAEAARGVGFYPPPRPRRPAFAATTDRVCGPCCAGCRGRADPPGGVLARV